MACCNISCLRLFPRKTSAVPSALDPQSSVATGSNVVELAGQPERGPNDGIKVLSPEGPNVFPEVDIVAVHGLGGDAEGTWTDSNTGTFWLREFLVRDITGAHIMTFGYDAKVFSKSVSKIPNFSEKLLGELRRHRGSDAEKNRPLIFICHSLGGIVCKQALILAHERSKFFQDILTSTYGIIFMGTPHEGSKFAVIGRILDVLSMVMNVGGVGKSVRRGLVNDLSERSELLTNISRSFVERGGDLRIVSFYEELCLPGFTEPLVNNDSATLGFPNELILPIHADHRNICRFGDRGNNYRTVLSELRQLCGGAVELRKLEHRREMIGRQQRDEKQDKVLEIIRGSSSGAADQGEIGQEEVTEHCPGTCTWILQDPKYKFWNESLTTGGLWLSGDPGTGKTVMTKFIMDTLRKTQKLGYNPVYVSVFCRQDHTTNFAALLRSILYQILVQDGSLFGLISHDVQKMVRREGDMLSALGNMILAMKDSLFLIIDGVDELEEKDRRTLLKSLKTLMETAQSETPRFSERGTRLKILISSRPHGDIEILVKDIPHLRFTDNEENIAQDIRKFVSDSICTFAESNHVNLDTELVLDTKRISLKMEIENAIVDGAGQMFQWASLAWATFLGASHQQNASGSVWQHKLACRWTRDELNADGVKERLELLRTLPSGLDDLYNNLLRDIPEACLSDAKMIFRCLLAATRPLHVTELIVILSMKKSGRWRKSLKESTSREVNIQWKERIKLSCGALVSIKNDNTIRFLHHTVREFLTLQPPNASGNAPQPPNAISEWKFGHDEVHSDLANFCVSYLSFEEFSVGPLKAMANGKVQADFQLECEESFSSTIAESPFLEYASVYWSHHIDRASKTEIQENFMRFAACNQKMNLAFQIFWFSEGCGGAFPSNMSPLHILCYYGLDALIPQVTPDNIHQTDTYGRTPLHWAVVNGHLTTVQMLLRQSEGLDLSSSEAISALHLAADQGHTELVALFLSNGADPNTIDPEFGTPLQSAAYNGHSNVVSLLLDRGADANARGGTLGTALQAAANGGHLQVVKQLLGASANVNAQTEGSIFQNALQAALGESRIARDIGNEDHEIPIVSLILHHGADVNACGGVYGDALQAAAIHGKKDAVELLLSHGARVDNGGGVFSSALEAAADRGYDKVLALLLRVDKVIAHVEGARVLAIQNGHDRITKMLDNEMGSCAKPKDSYPVEGSAQTTKNRTDAVGKWGAWTFKKLVKGGRKKEVDIMMRVIDRKIKTYIQARNRDLVRRLASTGAEVLQAVITIPDDRMIRRLVESGLSVLQTAIREYNGAKDDHTKKQAKIIMDDISGIWIVALESAIKGMGGLVVETAMDSTASQFKQVLGEADEKYAEAGRLPESKMEAVKKEAAEKEADAITLSHAAVQLFLAAVRGGKQNMVKCLGSVVAKALAGALEGKNEHRTHLVKKLVADRGGEFQDALRGGNTGEAEALFKGGLATLLAAVEIGSQNLVKIISTIWAMELQTALNNGHRSTVSALVSAQASDFNKVIDEEKEAMIMNQLEDQAEATTKVKALSEAGLAVSLAAAQNRCSDLVDTMFGIWVTELHSASAGENINGIEHLVTEGAKAFKSAVDRTRDDHLEAISSTELSETEAIEEAVFLSDIGSALLFASIEIGHSALTKALSRAWAGAFDSLVSVKRSKVMRLLVENRAAVFKEAVDTRLWKKFEVWLKVVDSLLQAAAEKEERSQLSGILTEIWLSALNSAADGKCIKLIEKIVREKALEFNTAVVREVTEADTILSIGLRLVLSSITHTSETEITILDLMSGIWAGALQAAFNENYDIVAKLSMLKNTVEEFENGSEAEAAVGIVLLLAAVEGSMEETMDSLFHFFGSSLDRGDEGRYGGLIKKLAKSKAQKFSSMQRGDEKARRVVEAVTMGKYGLAAKKLVTGAIAKRWVPGNWKKER